MVLVILNGQDYFQIMKLMVILQVSLVKMGKHLFGCIDNFKKIEKGV